MKVSTNFIRSEFGCQCGCGFEAVDVHLVEALQDVRDYFDSSYPEMDIHIKITSGNRCLRRNGNVGGSPTSYHIKGMAADFKVIGVHADVVADYLEQKYPNCFGVGRYTGWTHLDVRATPARWDRRGL